MKNIVGLKERFPDIPIGFSDHTIGSETSTAAVALGANVIEKHFTVSHIGKTVDSAFSLNEKGMKNFVSGLNTPSKFVLLEPFWMDRMLQSFSACDDWASLLRNSKEFRSTQKG